MLAIKKGLWWFDSDLRNCEFYFTVYLKLVLFAWSRLTFISLQEFILLVAFSNIYVSFFDVAGLHDTQLHLKRESAVIVYGLLYVCVFPLWCQCVLAVFSLYIPYKSNALSIRSHLFISIAIILIQSIVNIIRRIYAVMSSFFTLSKWCIVVITKNALP